MGLVNCMGIYCMYMQLLIEYIVIGLEASIICLIVYVIFNVYDEKVGLPSSPAY